MKNVSVFCQAVGYSAFDISLRVEFEKPGLFGRHSGLVVAIPLMLLLDFAAILDCHLTKHLVDTRPQLLLRWRDIFLVMKM